MDRCHFQGFLLFQWRQQPGQAAGEQRLAGAWWSAEQEVMAAGGSHQQGAFGGHLALDIGEVGVGRAIFHQALGLVGGKRRMAGEVRGQLQQVPGCQDLEAAGEAGFLGVLPGHHQGAAGGAGGQCGGQYALHGAQGAGERQFAQALHLFQGVGRQLAAGGEHAKGDGEIEAATVFRQVGRGEVEGDAAGREVEAAVLDRAAHAVLAFLHRGFRKAYQGEGRQAVGEVGFDGHGRGFDADLRATVDDGQGH
ncbi:hypothetical protein D9M70_369490 [compost metagenome]